jgi:hypothetical protein
MCPGWRPDDSGDGGDYSEAESPNVFIKRFSGA